MYVVLCKFDDWCDDNQTVYIGTFTTKEKAENAIIESVEYYEKLGYIGLDDLDNYEIEEYTLNARVAL